MKLRDILRRNRGKLVVLLLMAGVLAWYAHVHGGEWTREDVVAYGRGLPAGWFVLAFMVLPLLGFPISILLVLAGVRFGIGWGAVVATAGVAVHNLAAYHITHSWFRDRLRGRLERAGYGMPRVSQDHPVWFTALFVAVHGPPYAAKLYLLALTDIPFRIYFWVGAPVYLAFCLIPVGAGSAVITFDFGWMYALVTAFALLALAAHWLNQRLAGQK